MSTINKKLLGFIFNGANLALASAPFKGNLNSITGFNAAGTGFISYRPTSTFNSLTQLIQDGVYIVDAATVGFDIPGATLTAGSGGATSGNKTLPTFSGPAGETTTEFAETYFFDQTSTPSVAFSQGVGTVQLSYDEGLTWAALGPQIAANNGFKVRVQHPNNQAFTVTISLTY